MKKIISVMGVLVLLAACSPNSGSREQAECESSAPVEIEIDGISLLIPAGTRGYTFPRDPYLRPSPSTGRAEYPSMFCASMMPPSLEPKEILFTDLRFELEQIEEQFIVSSLRISPLAEGDEDFFESKRDWSLFEADIIDPDFLSIKRAFVGMASGEVFLQRNPELFAPSGHPIAFKCYFDRPGKERECMTWWVDASRGLFVNMNFESKDVPSRSWLFASEATMEFIDEVHSDTSIN